MNIQETADSIIRLEFSIGGYWGNSYHLNLTPDGIELQTDSAIDIPPHKRRPIHHTPTRFKRLIRRLFRHYGIFEWEQKYTEPHIMDGTHWQLTLHRSEPLPPLSFSGSNAYPPSFRRLLRLLTPYLHPGNCGERI